MKTKTSRTLIVYLHGIGDNIMLTGVLKKYSEMYPDEAIDLVVLNKPSTTVWENNPLVESVSVYPKTQPHFWNPVEFYLLHQFTVKAYIRRLNHDRRYQKVIFPTIQTFPQILFYVTGTYGLHKIHRMCEDMGVPKMLYPYDLHPTEKDLLVAEEIVGPLKQIAVIHPFSGGPLRRLKSNIYLDVINNLQTEGFHVIVVGAKNDEAGFKNAISSGAVSDRSLTLLFGYSFGTLIGVLRHASRFIGTDSMMVHLAGFANVPRISIYTPVLQPKWYAPVSESSQIEFVKILKI